MKIESAQIRNFRMLKEMNIDFEEILSLVIGKNNSVIILIWTNLKQVALPQAGTLIIPMKRKFYF